MSVIPASFVHRNDGEIPAPGDYDGNGTLDFAVYDPSSRTWRVKDQFETQHGGAGEIPLVQGR